MVHDATNPPASPATTPFQTLPSPFSRCMSLTPFPAHLCKFVARNCLLICLSFGELKSLGRTWLYFSDTAHFAIRRDRGVASRYCDNPSSLINCFRYSPG